jgi:Sec-independent protein translocase protein TatA
MKQIISILALLMLQYAVANAQDSETDDEENLTKKELRQKHREERKEARYEKHHPDEVTAEDSEEKEAATAPKKQAKSAVDIEEDVESALAEHEAIEADKEIQQSDRAFEQPDSETDEDVEGPTDVEQDVEAKDIDWTWLYVTIFAVILLLVVRSRLRKRCKACKSWGSMKEIKRRITDTKNSTIEKKLETKDASGKVLKTTAQLVPATVTYTDVHRQCKKCGHKDIKKETKKAEN